MSAATQPQPQPQTLSSKHVHNYEQLCKWMKDRTTVVFIEEGCNVEGMINCIQAEDGSGKCWNVTFSTGQTVFLRTN